MKDRALLQSVWKRSPSLLYRAVLWAIRLVMLVVVPRNRTPAAAQAWLLLVFSSPWLGLLLYALIGNRKLTRWRRQFQYEIDQALAIVMQYAHDDPQMQPLFDYDLSPTCQQIENLARRLGGMAAFAGNSVTLLPDYNQSIQTIIADIDAATTQIHLLYYIFGTDATGNAVRDALLRAARRGVKCRVLVDAIGSYKSTHTLLTTLRVAGVATHVTLPVQFIARERTRFDLRNHRKIIIIDNQIGYTGSQNIVDATYKHTMIHQELVVRVTGPVVLQLQAVFAGDWYLETGEQLFDQLQLDTKHLPIVSGTATVQVLASGPTYETNNNLLLFTNLFYYAQKRVVIVTPYFIPDESLLTAIESAALRGVEIHLIVSKIADQFMVSRAQRSYYTELMAVGVHIHMMNPPTLLHAKHLSIDDQIAVIGSSNLDMRSFQLNLEAMLIIYDKQITCALQAIEYDYMQRSMELNLEVWNKRPFTEQFLEDTLRLMSPLL